MLQIVSELLANIIEKKRTDEILKRSEEKFKKIFNNSIEGILLINKNGQILEANNTIKEWLKYKNGDLKEKNIFLSSILSLKNKKRLYDLIKKVKNEEKTKTIEIELKAKNKKIFLVEMSCCAYEKNETEWKGLLFIKNLEENKEIKNEMHQLQKKFSMMVEKASDSIIITDVKGNIEYVNPFFEKITGYKLKELIGKNPRILKSGRQPREFYEELWQTITSGKIWEGELINKNKNGEEYIERATITPILNEENKIINYIAMKYDITSLKKYEKDMKKHIEELEEFKDATVDRELKMIEIEKENKELKKQLRKTQ
jgi:two-component system, NtrC family, sensor kinase